MAKKSTKPSSGNGEITQTSHGSAIKPSRGQYPPEVRRNAVDLILGGASREKVAQQIGCCTESLRLWVKAAKEQLREAKPASSTEKSPESFSKESAPQEETACTVAADNTSVAECAAAKTAPKDPGAGLSDHEVAAILSVKKRSPSMGPAQIRAQLKRFKGWRISNRAIARVLRHHGYDLEHRKGRPEEPTPPTRWEAPHRNALWQTDFTDLRVPEGRRALGVIIDDFSRFVVGFGLFQSPTSEDVVAMFKEAIRRHGKPEAVYTDRAGPFTAWGKEESFQRFLQEELIDHHVTAAYRPQGRGKVEAIIKTVQRELWDIQHFASEEEAVSALADFFERYNHRRAHMALDGLTPADRFFGRWEAVLAAVQAESRKRQGVEALKAKVALTEEPPFAERAEILRLVAVNGAMELRLFGHRVRLGQIEA
jgi:transposase InsO family protein/transposase-like protein